MANNKTTNNEASSKKEVPATLKTVGSLVEVVARLLAAYLVLDNFTNVIALAAGWYFLVTAVIIIVMVFAKAFKK